MRTIRLGTVELEGGLLRDDIAAIMRGEAKVVIISQAEDAARERAAVEWFETGVEPHVEESPSDDISVRRCGKDRTAAERARRYRARRKQRIESKAHAAAGYSRRNLGQR